MKIQGAATGDLLDYPSDPGFKEKGGTSELAARRVAAHAETLRGKALALLKEIYPLGLSSDEVAAKCGVTVLAMRPRITELGLMGLIEKTGATVRNISGHPARVWRYKP